MGRIEARIAAYPAARTATLVAALVFAVALLAGAVRVLPLLLADGVPASAAWVLGRGVLGAALETSLLVGPAIGFGLTAADLVARGEARAAYALGASPASILAGFVPGAIAFAAILAVAAAIWGREARSPASAVRDLVAASRRDCEARRDREGAVAIAEVPLFDLTWVCFPSAPSRAIGATPFGAFSARSIDVSDDLRELHAEGLQVLVAGGDEGDARIDADHATVRGLAPFAVASNLPSALRAALVAASSILFAIASAFGAVRFGIASRARAIAVAASGPAAALLVFSSLERGPARLAPYALVPLAGLGAIALLTTAFRERA